MLQGLAQFHAIKPKFFLSATIRKFSDHRIVYNKENYKKDTQEYIEKVCKMTYKELLTEAKLMKIKPSRKRETLIQEIINELPLIALPEVDTHLSLNASSILKNKLKLSSSYLINYPNLIGLHDVFENLENFSFGEKIPYIENYQKEQIGQEIEKMSIIEARREVQLFASRSNLFSQRGVLKSIKKMAKDSVHQNFYSLILLEREYMLFPQVLDSKNLGNMHIGLANAVEIVKFLSNSTNFWRSRGNLQQINLSYYKFFLNLLISNAEKYDESNIESILAFMVHLKNHKIISIENAIGREELDKLTAVIIELVQAHRDHVNEVEILANILNYLNEFKDILAESTLINMKSLFGFMLDMYITREKKFLASNISPEKLISIFNALANFNRIDEKKTETVLKDIFVKLTNIGVEYLDKASIMKILNISLVNNVKLPHSLGALIKKNLKMLESLQLNEIYLLIYSFKTSNIELGPIYQNLYISFCHCTKELKGSNEITFKTIQYIAKIFRYILDFRIGDHRPNQLEKRAFLTFQLIEESLLKLDPNSYTVEEVIDISSDFIHHLSTPDFLFQIILQKISSCELTPQNSTCYSSFIHKLNKKYQKSYTFYQYLTLNELDINNKWTPISLSVLEQLISLFFSSTNISYKYFGMIICSNKELFDLLYKDKKEELLTKIFSIIPEIIELKDIKYNKKDQHAILLELMAANSEFLTIEKHGEIFELLLKDWIKINNKNSQILSSLPNFYLLAQIVNQFYKNNPDQNMSVEFLKMLRQIMQEQIFKKILENSKYNSLQVKYDKNIIQYFNVNICNFNFNNLEFVLPLIKLLDLKLHQDLMQALAPQFKRAYKKWEGEILLNNLILLDETNQNFWEIYENSIENLTTFYDYIIESQTLVPRDFLTDERAEKLIRAYLNQFKKADYPVVNKNLIFLSVYFSHYYSSLKEDEIFIILRLLGNNKYNYSSLLLKQLSATIKDIIPSFNNLGQFYCLPQFLSIGNIEKYIDTVINYGEESFDALILSINVLNKWKKFYMLFYRKLFQAEYKLLISEKNIDSVINYLLMQTQVQDFESILNLFEDIFDFLAKNYDRLLKTSLIFCFHKIKFQESGNTLSDKGLLFEEKLKKNILKVASFDSQSSIRYFEGHQIIAYPGLYITNNMSSFSNYYKVLPKNSTNIMENNQNTKDLKNKKTMKIQDICIDEAILYHLASNEEKNISSSYYHKNLILFLLKKLNFGKGEKNFDQNQSIEAEFVKLSKDKRQTLKIIENYTNILVDLSLVFHKLDMYYQTVYTCPTSLITVDFYLEKEEICVVILMSEEYSKNYDNDQSAYMMNMYSYMKFEVLKTANPKRVVIPIYAEEWLTKYNKKSDQFAYIKEILSQKNRKLI